MLSLPNSPRARRLAQLLVSLVACSLSHAAATEDSTVQTAGLQLERPRDRTLLERPRERMLVAEMGAANFEQASTPSSCSLTTCGNVSALLDYPLASPEVMIPTDGSPWGTHMDTQLLPSPGACARPQRSRANLPNLRGPAPHGCAGVHLAPEKAEGAYVITWYEGTAVVGPDSQSVPDTSREHGSLQLFILDEVTTPPRAACSYCQAEAELSVF
jgi:hypothetical protein